MAQTLKFGNGNFATKAGSTLCYDDQNGNFKPIPMDFTRASTATRVNKQGLIEVVKSNVPRIDYTDTSDGVLLLEKAATNLIQYSEAFDNSYWSKNDCTVSDGFLSPDGNLNAFKLIENSSNSSHGLGSGTIQTTNFLSYFSFIFVKKSERNWVYYRTNIGSSFIYQWFDLTNNIASSSVGTFDDAGVVEYSNDWVMCWIKKTETTGSARQNQWFLSTDDLVQTYQGDGTSGVLVFGAQLEVGNLSSYIPTQGSARTRVAETATGSGNSEVFNDSEGVLFADIAANSDYGGVRAISLNDGSVLNRISIRYNSTSNQIQYQYTSGGSVQVDITSNVADVKTPHKIAVKYKLNDFELFIDGFSRGTDLIGNVMPSGTLTNLDINGSSVYDYFYGKTKELGYYNTALTDLELETLTSYRSWISMVNELNLNIIYNG